MNFTFEGLQAAESTVARLRNFRSRVSSPHVSKGSGDGSRPDVARIAEIAVADFEAAMDDDFNTASALAAVHDMVRETNTLMTLDGLTAEGQQTILDAISKFDSVFGIFGKEESDLLDADIEGLIEERQEARRNRNFARSDEIRDELAEKGIVLEDTPQGVRWKRR